VSAPASDGVANNFDCRGVYEDSDVGCDGATNARAVGTVENRNAHEHQKASDAKREVFNGIVSKEEAVQMIVC